MSSLKFLIEKEVTQFTRSRFLPILVFIYPVAIMLIAPLIANMDVKNVRVAFVDHDGRDVSQRMISHLNASDYFRVMEVTADYGRAFSDLEKGRVDVIIDIPDGFEKSLLGGIVKKIKVDANAVNSTKATLGSQYVMQTLAGVISEVTAPGTAGRSPELSVRYLFNETLDYRFYMIPAFMIILVMIICCFIPALNLVQEKEKGTIEQINVTPVSRFEFTLSKLIPYWAVGVLVITEAILTVGIVYGLWPTGNVLSIYLASLLFALAMSGFAVTIANKSDSMQQSIFVLFFFVMIFMLMSGLLTPLSSMPQWARYVAGCFPTSHFVEILRSVYLKGTSISELGQPYLILTGMAVILCSLSAVTYRKQE